MNESLSKVLRNILLLVLALYGPTLFEHVLDRDAIGWGASPVVDLGTARYPAMAGVEPGGLRAHESVHDWQGHARRVNYRVGYAHGRDDALAVERRHADLARRFGYRENGDETFSWQVPQECSTNPWNCIYEQVLADSESALEPLADRLTAHLIEEGWSEADAARWVLTLVQEIPYALPGEHAFGLLPPAIVASRDWGDCDSKSLLLIALLERLGIGSVLLVSEAHAHAVVGVEVRAGHDSFEYAGRRYAWAETTAAIPLGSMPPRLLKPDDWKVVLFR